MSSLASKKKRECESASQSSARHSGESRNPEPLASVISWNDNGGNTKLPPGWKLTTLGAEFRWGSGGTPKSTNPAFYDGAIPWAIIGDLNDGPVDSTARAISEAGLKNSSAKLVEPGSVLVAMYGSIGKLGIASVPLATNQAIAFTKPECCSAKFLFWYLYFARPQLIKLGKGGTQSNINQTVLKAFPFVLPPREDQQRIVAEIEKQFTRLDAGVAALRRVQANLKRYRAAVLKAACEGRLVPTEVELAKAEGRTYETGEQLLARILTDRRRNWQGHGTYKEPAVLDTTNLPLLPEGWARATMPQLGELGRGKSKHRPRDDTKLYGGPYPFIQTGDVRKSGGTIRDYTQTYSGFGLRQSRLWPAGTLCITIAANIAETGILKFDACFPDSVVGFVQDIRPSTTRYLEFFLRTAREKLEQFAPATAQKNINLDVLRKVAIPLPPLAEQIRIVAEVECRLSIVEELEATVTANLQRTTRLRQSILMRAFGLNVEVGRG